MNKPLPDEARLVKRAQRRDRGALEVLMSRHERRLYLCALSMVNDSWDAQDAVQDASLEILQGIGRLRDETRFLPWAIRIVKNKCHDLMRHRKRVELSPAAASRSRDDTYYIASEEDQSILTALRDLEPDRRLAVALRYFADMSYAEIAEAADCPRPRPVKWCTGMRMALEHCLRSGRTS